jgi:hypothetical protein
MSRRSAVLVAALMALCAVAIVYSVGFAIWFRYEDDWVRGELTVFDSSDYRGRRSAVLLSWALVALGIVYAVRLVAQAVALATGRPSSLPWSTLDSSMRHAGLLAATAAIAVVFPPSGTEQVDPDLWPQAQIVTFDRASGALWLFAGLAIAQAGLYVLHTLALRALEAAKLPVEAPPVAKPERPLVKSPPPTGGAVDADPFRAPPQPVIAAVSNLAPIKPAPRATSDAAAGELDEPKLLR